ncbi:MAG: cyclic nucleotide-binding domain-containing protein [Candidatus Dormibacteria bacterium]|jgi:CRP-like cAMP-binding protein|nr:cyclic nucleotide-binding protein [Chloroflexota bacterium]HBV93663.1 cyclic nucleotide-binding protein [Chloroflexota bacterium]
MAETTTVWGLFHNATDTRKVSAGAVIFSEGDPGAEMYGIVDGEVELRGAGGLMERLGPREVFGEMALVDDSPRSATAVALTETTLATVDRRRFLFLVQETPMFALELMSVMADRLRRKS